MLKRVISSGIDYADSLRGIKYGEWKESMDTRFAPIYGLNGPPPERSVLEKQGIACSGLINLVRRYLGLTIPQYTIYPGGTEAWYRYLKVNKLLSVYHNSNEYQKGTLLLTRYKNEKDQGHMMIVINHEGNNITLLHSTEPVGVIMECSSLTTGMDDTSNNMSNMNIEIEYTCKPYDWLI